MPRLAPGIEVIGEYEGSGYVDPHYVVRRSDGSVVQLTRLLYLVCDAVDGRRGYSELADAVSDQFGRRVSADNVRTLVEDKLVRLGVTADPDGSTPDVETLDPLLALRWRMGVVTPHQVARLGRALRLLFVPPVVLAAIGGLVAVDWWLFFVHGVGQAVRATMYQPAYFLLAVALIVASAAAHEAGHATGCVYGGARPGKMGAGVYLVWPAFYTDVTDAYRLNRGGRLRTDLGGIYFTGLLVLLLAGGFALTGSQPLLLVAFLLQVEVVHQMLPFLRLDGYYVVSDLTGVPDLFRRIGPILRGLRPGRPVEPAVTELKRWVRVVVTGWTLLVIPILLLNLGMIVFSLPRIIATAWDSAAHLVGGIGHHGALNDVSSLLQLVVLALPTLGVLFTIERVGRRSVVGAWRWSRASAAKRTLVVVLALGAVAALALAWWPDRNYAPYRKGERGTLPQQVATVRNFGQGSPLFRSPAQAQTPLPPVHGNQSGTTARTVVGPGDARAPGVPGPAAPSSTTPGPGRSGGSTDIQPGDLPVPVPSLPVLPSVGGAISPSSVPSRGIRPSPAPSGARAPGGSAPRPSPTASR